MDRQLKPASWFDAEDMDAGKYFQSVVDRARFEGLISPGQYGRIQRELWALLAERCDLRTRGFSSSLPVETVQDILESIGYSIGVALKDMHDDRKSAERLCAQSLPTLFADGQRRIEHSLQEGRQLLARLQAGHIPVRHDVYADAVFSALPQFFRGYDPTFSAHETVCDLDYPLSLPVGDLCGVEYVNAYMRRLLLENAFCARFPSEKIDRLLQSLPDGRNAFVNLCDLVFCSAVGQALLHKNIVELKPEDADRQRLAGLYQNLSAAQFLKAADAAAKALFLTLKITDRGLVSYLRYVRDQFFVRAQHFEGNDFAPLLMLFPQPEAPEFAAQVEFGPQMSDERLRELIAELSDCAGLAQKLALLKDSVAHPNDFVEALDACFWEDELDSALGLLQNEELAYLWNRLCLRKGDALFCHEQNAAWENRLIDRVQALGLTNGAGFLHPPV